MGTISRIADRLAAPTVESCRYRRPVPLPVGEELASCDLLRQVLAALPDEKCHVARSVCEACCRSFPSSPAVLNPVIASLVYNRLQVASDQRESQSARALLRRVEQFLDINVVAPEFKEQPGLTFEGPPAGLRDFLPLPRRRCDFRVRHWAVGVTTAPRRHPTLERCLDSLSRAGWPRPVLFIDGPVGLPRRFDSLPVTYREEALGAWPHYYLSLTELLMREPLADAFLLVQDDALFYDRDNVRQYMEEVLWPGSTPGIVSLYCSTADTRPHFGWTRSAGRWKSGAVALVFPRRLAIDLVCDRSVLAHRWSDGKQGLVGIPDVVETWAATKAVPLFYPTPSLVQHIGATSAIWLGSCQLTPARQSDCFAGDIVRAPAAREAPEQDSGDAPVDPRAFRLDWTAAAFPEDRFPCSDPAAKAYLSRCRGGRERMRDVSAVICTLCRDVMHCLPATAARVERLADMFGRCQVVIFENDSRDSTLPWLQQWAAANSRVHVVSERLDDPNFAQEVSRERTARMAYYRNRCREAVLSLFEDYDYVIVLDADLEGGWSYDGIAHTFGDVAWDFVGSYGIWYEPDRSGNKLLPVHYDAFAFRRPGCDGLEDFPAVNSMLFRRGDPLLRLWSCFGGLGVYRMECFRSVQYEADDCEHVTFHRALRLLGYDRLFLNPSQIVVYTPFPERHGEST